MIEIFGIPYFKKGSGIHIKKKNRGKFTEYCGGKVTDECISRAKKSNNPKLRKRATFAANARKWKHQTGGMLSLIPKGQSGWISKLNPLNWGLRTYEGDIESAYDAAKANKDKKFLWKGIRISTKQIPMEQPSQESIDFTNRILKNSKIQGTSQSESNADKFSYQYLTTTPQQDSVWNVYDGINQVNVFKNGVTNKYDYSIHKNGKIVSEKESQNSIPQRLHNYIYSRKYLR